MARAIISITNLAERHLRQVALGHHEAPEVTISITNLAERHLRPLAIALNTLSLLKISITNLAERHLRRNRHLPISTHELDINHESSRKAFETNPVEDRD